MKKIDKIKLGTIGSGSIVQNVLAQVVKTPGTCLEAVYSREEEKGRKLADAYGCAKVYTDLPTFLQDDEINTVYIASPNLLHYEQSKAALDAGKNVICEKPFCIRASQGHELKELAQEKGLFIVEAVTTAFLPNFALLKKELPKIGRIRLVMGNYSQYSSRYNLLKAGELPNVFNPAFAGGSLMDINYYNVFLNVALFGKPQSVDYYPNMHAAGTDTSGILMLHYADFECECTGAKDTWGVNYFQIEGEDGYIYVTDGSNGLKNVKIVTRNCEKALNLQDDPDRYYYEATELTRMVLDGDYEKISAVLDITLDVMEVLENARKKAGIIFPGD